MILTGGAASYYQLSGAINRVQEYNLQGSVARLANLTTARSHHACGHYVHQGEIVSTEEEGSSTPFIVKPKYQSM